MATFVTRLSAPVIGLMVFLLVAAPAFSARAWCRRDPVFTVASVQVNVVIAIPEEHQPHVNGPLKVILYVPVGVVANVILIDEGFNGLSEEVLIVPSRKLRASARGNQIQVAATVPATRNDVPVSLQVIPAVGRSATIYGKTNAEVSVNTTVGAP